MTAHRGHDNSSPTSFLASPVRIASLPANLTEIPHVTTSKRGPIGPQEDPGSAQARSKSAPKKAPRGNSSASGGGGANCHSRFFAKWPSRWLPEGPPKPQRKPQESPKSAPRGPQRSPKSFQNNPNIAPSGSPRSLTSPLLAALLHRVLTYAPLPDSPLGIVSGWALRGYARRQKVLCPWRRTPATRAPPRASRRSSRKRRGWEGEERKRRRSKRQPDCLIRDRHRRNAERVETRRRRNAQATTRYQHKQHARNRQGCIGVTNEGL